MFTNPCESAQKFRNFLLLNLFCYTYRLFKAPRSLCSKIEKARTRKYCPLFTQQDSHSISFVVFSLALFMCSPGLKGYPPNRWPTMGESTFHEFPYITWRTALQTKRRWAPPSNKRCIHTYNRIPDSSARNQTLEAWIGTPPLKRCRSVSILSPGKR